MNLCGDKKMASLYDEVPVLAGRQRMFISIFTYGPAAAKSQNAKRPVPVHQRRRSRASLEPIPVTLDAAEKRADLAARAGGSAPAAPLEHLQVQMSPSLSSPITTTSQMDSRQGSSLEWCSYGPMKTTGRSAGGISAESP
jgi:hypothetical protein